MKARPICIVLPGNHFAAFIRERGKSRLLGDVTQDVVQEFIRYLERKETV